MAVLRYYNPLVHDIYHYPTPATQTSGGITPDGYSAECQTVAAGHKVSTKKWTKDTPLDWEIMTNGKMTVDEQKKFLAKVGLYDYRF